jgi:cell division protein FtsL
VRDAVAVPLPPGGAPSPSRPVRPAARPAFGAWALGVLRALPDHPLLDRLIRGRLWIPLLGLLLAGIVAMQVEVLKYGARIGQAVQASAALQSRNEMLRASVSALSSDTRIERLAAQAGMVMPAPGADRFVRVARGDLRRALAALAGKGNGSPAAGGAAPAAGGAAPAAGGSAPAAGGAAPAAGGAAPAATGG